MEIRFSKHSLEKLRIYGIPQEELIQAIQKPKTTCKDVQRGTVIKIFELKGKLFSCIVEGDLIITVYRTDERKLYSRIRSGRWKCY